jgi:hypothetical protein
MLDRFNDRLWQVTQHTLRDHADFEPTGFGFMLRSNPFADEPINAGPYRMGKDVEDANVYRVGHPLAQKVLERAMAVETPPLAVSFQLTGSGKNIAILDPLKGASGWLELRRIEIHSVDTEDRLVFGAIADSGGVLDAEQCRRLFDLLATVEGDAEIGHPDLGARIAPERENFLAEIDRRNRRWFEQKTESVEAWATDRQALLRAQVAEAEQAVADKRKAARLAPTMPEQVRLQGEVRKLQSTLEQAEEEYRLARKDVARERDRVLDEAAARLHQTVGEQPIFTLRWRVV